MPNIHLCPLATSAVSLATMKCAKNCLLLSAEINIYVNKTQKNQSVGVLS